MEKGRHRIQFQAEVDGSGRVTFSRPVHGLMLKPGSSVTVNIFGGIISKTLERLNVTEQEIEQIGSVQLEDREHVMTFLSSQGVLAKNTRFRRRMEQVLR